MRIVESHEFSDNFVAICPHCKQELREVVRIEDEMSFSKGFFRGLFKGKKGYCYACPHCRKVLGFADYSN